MIKPTQGNETIKQVAASLCGWLHKNVGSDNVCFYVWDRPLGHCIPVWAETKTQGWSSRFDQAIASAVDKVLSAIEVRVVDPISNDPIFGPLASPDLRSVIFLPYVLGSEPQGVLVVVNADSQQLKAQREPLDLLATPTLLALRGLWEVQQVNLQNQELQRSKLYLLTLLTEVEQRQHVIEQLTQEVKRTKGHLEGILENAAEGLISVDRTGTIQSANEQAAVLLGYSKAHMINWRIVDLVPQVAREEIDRLVQRALAGETVKDVETFWPGANGTRAIRVTLSPLRDKLGEILGAVGIISDITERKRAEEEIRRHLQRITLLREINLATTSTLDLYTILETLLEKIARLLPYSPAITVRLFNKKSGELEPLACWNINQEEWKARRQREHHRLAKMVIETKAPLMVGNLQTDPRRWDPEFCRRHGLVSYLGVPLIAKEEVLGVLSFYTKEEHQFTNEEVQFLATLAGQAAIAIYNSQLYEQTKKQAVELERANKVKSEFLSVMSHELRTPLNVVRGYAEMLSDGMLGELSWEQEDALGKIIGRSNELITMVDSILEAARLEAETIELDSQEVSLRDFVGDLRSFYSVPLDKDLTLAWDCPSELPAIKTDSRRLRHILESLIGNAIKFTNSGDITISTRYLPEANSVEFKVADTGVGIPKEALPHIFEIFRQADSSDARSYGGVGMGLYIVRKFTEILGGTVEVESVPGRGSTFTVRLPYEI